MTNNQVRISEPVMPVLECRNGDIYYGNHHAVRGINIALEPYQIHGFIGPSGCGKSTLVRCWNRMNDKSLIPTARVEGLFTYKGVNLYGKDVDPVKVRSIIGMVAQRATPFPKTIYENVAWGIRINGIKGDMDEMVEKALRGAALWDEVKNKLKLDGRSLSGGQQQRLCIARAIAIEPEVILMDEPCSALDPIATGLVEELILELRRRYTIVVVTHQMAQAQRIADTTAFFNTGEVDGVRYGYLAEHGTTEQIFQDPQLEATRDYVHGVFG